MERGFLRRPARRLVRRRRSWRGGEGLPGRVRPGCGHDVDTFEELKALEARLAIAADLYVVDALGAEASPAQSEDNIYSYRERAHRATNKERCTEDMARAQQALILAALPWLPWPAPPRWRLEAKHLPLLEEVMAEVAARQVQVSSRHRRRGRHRRQQRASVTNRRVRKTSPAQADRLSWRQYGCRPWQESRGLLLNRIFEQEE